VHGAAIVMSSTSGLCKDAATSAVHPNQKAVVIRLFDDNGMTVNTPTAPDIYFISDRGGTPPSKVATWNASVLDATCNEIEASHATAFFGTVRLSGINGNTFSGSYDVVLDNDDHVTGSFDPEACPDIQKSIGGTTPSTCI
jgi:hypothetical protein